MTSPRNPVVTIAEKLKALKIFPEGLDADAIEDEHALMQALREHTRGAQLKFYGEDVGTDNGADEDYVAMLRRFGKASGGAIAYDKLQSGMEGDTVNISFESEGRPVTWSFEQESDSMSEEFLQLVMDHSKTCSAGEFINLLDDNSLMVGYVPREIAQLLYAHDVIY